MDRIPVPELFPASLQRCAEWRTEPDWAAAARADPGTRFLVARGPAHLVRREPQAQIAFQGADEPVIAALDESELVLLGRFQGQRCVLALLPAESPFQPVGTEYEELRPLLSLLPDEQAQLLTYARALQLWRARQRFCGVCGAPTRPRSAGHVMACTNSACASEFFPRIDPAIIVLVSDGARALLGRQKSWPPGRYSALAGFVEPGESLEQAVAREVEEETGTRVDEVTYFSSQPWPFPASLMVGFHARARAGAITLDGELEDARWFDLDQLANAPAHLLPPPFTIARRLLEAWFQSQSAAQR